MTLSHHVSPTDHLMVVFRVTSPTARRRCLDALNWLGRPGLQASSVRRSSHDFVIARCDDAGSAVIARQFIIGIDPAAIETDV